jgi:microcystin-dependent protein
MDEFIGVIKLFAGNYAPQGWAFCNGQTLSISQNQALFSILGTTYGGDGKTTFQLPDLGGRVPVGTGQGLGLTPCTLGERAGLERITLNPSQMAPHNHEFNFSNNSTAVVKINTTAKGTITTATASGDFPATAPIPVTGGKVTIPVSAATRGNTITDPSQGLLTASTGGNFYGPATPTAEYKGKGTLTDAVVNIPPTKLSLSVSGSVDVPIFTTGRIEGSTMTSISGSGAPVEIRTPYLGMNYIICLEGIYPSRN